MPERIALSTRDSERRDIALLLQFETVLIDAAGGVDRQRKLEIDRLRQRRRHAASVGGAVPASEQEGHHAKG